MHSWRASPAHKRPTKQEMSLPVTVQQLTVLGVVSSVELTQLTSPLVGFVVLSSGMLPPPRRAPPRAHQATPSSNGDANSVYRDIRHILKFSNIKNQKNLLFSK